MKTYFWRKATAFMLSAFVLTCFTACDDDDDDDSDFTEQFTLSAITATANSDGTFNLSGTVTTNTKLKTFELEDENGTVYDLLANSEQESERTEEDGKVWTTTLTYENLPVQVYTLTVRTRLNGSATKKIGEPYTSTLGTGDNTEVGSYYSLLNLQSYMLSNLVADDAIISGMEEEAAAVEIALSSTTSIKTARTWGSYTGVNSKVLNPVAGQALILDDVVITSTKCIASYTLTEVDSKTVEISGVRILAGDNDIITIDISEIGFED